MKLPAIRNQEHRRIVRDVIQRRIAKVQVRKSHLSGKSALRECDAAIDAMLDVLGDLVGVGAAPEPEDE